MIDAPSSNFETEMTFPDAVNTTDHRTQLFSAKIHQVENAKMSLM